MNQARISMLVACLALQGCLSPSDYPRPMIVPAMEYAKKFRRPQRGEGERQENMSYLQQQRWEHGRAQLRLARDEAPVAQGAVPSELGALPAAKVAVPAAKVAESGQRKEMAGDDDMVMNLEIYRSRQPNIRDYSGPLALGDPGISSSLWQESKRDNVLFRDERAWQPLDLVTIIISESSEGKKEADTEVKHKSSVVAAIEFLLGLEKSIPEKNPDVDPANLINAQTTNDFKGEGETTRKGTLKAKISAMVAEVLPGQILRIEGEKIISVNEEEQVLVISGLVRPRDINSNNEVDSSKLANLRIDYYGKGTVGEAQFGGWFSRLVRILWPF
jgi:flagellar L-ring protein FlgH